MEKEPEAKARRKSPWPHRERQHEKKRDDVRRHHTDQYVEMKEEHRDGTRFEAPSTREDTVRASVLHHPTSPAARGKVFGSGTVSFESPPKEVTQENLPQRSDKGQRLCEDARTSRRGQTTGADDSRAESTCLRRSLKGQEPLAEDHARGRQRTQRPTSQDLELRKLTGENDATSPARTDAATSSLSTRDVVKKKTLRHAELGTVLPAQAEGTTNRQLSAEGLTTGDPPDSLEVHVCDGKREKSLKDYIYYDTNSGPRSATANTTEICLADSSGNTGNAFSIESLGFPPRTTTRKSKASTGRRPEDTCQSREVNERILKDVIAATPMVLVMVVFAIVIMLRHFRSSKDEYVASGTHLAYVCEGDECTRVLDVLLEGANATINPCDDFYSHVCGRWGARMPGRMSYAAENRRNFTENLHRLLTNALRSPSLCAQREYEMARFYNSCHAFVRGSRPPSVSVVLAKAEINIDAWLRCTTLEELMITVLETCLRTGLSSVVNAFASSGVVGMEPGTTISSSLKDKDGSTVAKFIEWALRGLELRNETEMWLFLKRTDTDLAITGLTFDRSNSFKKSSIGELDPSFPKFSWTAVFRHVVHNGTMLTSESIVHIRGLEQLKSIIASLHTDKPVFRNIYVSLVALAQLAKYEYILSSSDANDREVVESCLQVTGQYFPTLLGAWVVQTALLPQSMDYAEGMLSAFKTLGHKAPRLSDKMNVSTDDVLRQHIALIGATEVGTTSCSRNPPVIYSKDFLDNVVLAARGEESSPPDVRQLSHSIAQRQLDGSLMVDVSTGALMLPALYLSSDLLHPEVSEPVLDYSTVGVRVLVELAHMLLSRRSASHGVVAYKECVQEKAQEYIADNVSDSTLREMLFIPWAVDFALLAALYEPQRRALQPMERKLKSQLFFQRFCQTLCGDPEGAKVCAYAALQSNQFSVAFDCPRTRDVSC
ncbi:hypothetical protein HPB50_007208 [Hyalomma asiaticum]|uniref:Uncharacterized protein n=1 Tax=Hyalomma asiaticum TaxID=266040 RepID=A0ACB7SLT2_HYAAI|nr:hypothetical protein HPB50_007208 [Hyalomma asiaticum]